MGGGKKMERKKMERKRIRDFGIVPGVMKTGPKNKITDVPGVLVGHKTVRSGDSRTGVTVIVPGPGNVFDRKFIAAGYVHNGFGKTCGLVQVEELGTLETPIALTNTLNVGLAADALVEYTIRQCAKEQVEVTSVSPVVGECNDCKINRIQHRAVSIEDVMEAFSRADEDFEEGDVGAGTGTVCYGLKGGIGSASRIMRIGGKKYTLGVLVQSNFGATEDLVINGIRAGERILEEKAQEDGRRGTGPGVHYDHRRHGPACQRPSVKAHHPQGGCGHCQDRRLHRPRQRRSDDWIHHRGPSAGKG